MCIVCWCFYALSLSLRDVFETRLFFRSAHTYDNAFSLFVCVRFLKNLPSAFLPWNTVREESYILKTL